MNPRNCNRSCLKTSKPKRGRWWGIPSVYYGSYVFFEKLRLRDGKPKSKKRLGTEAAWAFEGGVNRKRQGKYLCGVGDVVYEDEFGRARSMRG